MKKTIYFFMLMLVAGLCFSCSDDDNGTSNPVLSFASKITTLPAKGSVEVVLNSSLAAAESMTVRFSLGGTAVEGEDYEISAKEFTFQAGEKSSKVVITAKENYTEGRNIELELLPTAGVELAADHKLSILVETKEQLIYSFVQENYGLTSSVKVELELKGMKSGSNFTAPEEIRIPFTVSSVSTAVKGEHYTISDDATEFVFKPGSRKVSVQINFLKSEEGKDKIVLAIGNLGAQYVRGNYKEAKVQIYGPTTLGKLIGKWCFKEARSFTWLAEYVPMNGYPTTETDNLPVNNSDKDTLEFVAGDPGSLKLHLEGDLKNYFRDCNVTYLEDQKMVLMEEGMPSKFAMISVMRLSQANVAFSPSTKSLRPAVVGFRVLDDGVTLEVSVYDYEPVDFMKQVYTDALGYAGEDVPMSYFPIRYHFSRIAE